MRRDRMFHVLVLGGVALVACGGSAAVSADAGSGDGGRGGYADDADLDGGSLMDVSADAEDGPYQGFFPSETATVLDGSLYVEPDAGGADGGGPAGDASADAGYQFPFEAP